MKKSWWQVESRLIQSGQDEYAKCGHHHRKVGAVVKCMNKLKKFTDNESVVIYIKSTDEE